MRLTDEELALVRTVAATTPLCCEPGPGQCDRCRLTHGADELALEVEALRAGLPPEPVAVLQASALAEVAVLARELVDALGRDTPLRPAAHAALSRLKEALEATD